MEAIYLDNAATSFPKPAGVSDRMKYYLDCVGANVNRSVYTAAQEAGLVTLTLRQRLARLFDFPEPPTHVILTPGATAGLNMIISGLLRPGDHCIVSSMEHNAVMRPLHDLAEQGVTFDRIPCDRTGRLNPADIPAMIKPNTCLLVMAHGSNVSGTVQDAVAVGAICREYSIPFVLDAAQTAGHYPVDFKAMNLSALSMPGHKGLMGPSGIGALLLSRDFAQNLTPIATGGTGSASDSEAQPNYMPDKFESGTPNVPGIYGLQAAVDFILNTGVDAMQRREQELTKRFLDGLRDVKGIRLAGSWELENRVGVISIDFETIDNAEAAYQLEQDYGILTRCGLHCAPAAHKTLGTFPQGTVRFSPGHYTTEEEIDAAVKAIAELAQG